MAYKVIETNFKENGDFARYYIESLADLIYMDENKEKNVKQYVDEKTAEASYTHPDAEREDTTSSQSAAFGGTVEVVDSVESDEQGHITGVNTKTVTMPPTPTSVSGNAGTATKLQNARTIAISGGATGTATAFDGSQNITIPITALDASKLTGTIAIERLPHGALERCVIVADDTARFELTTASVQTGDTVKVTSTGLMYFVVDDAKLDSEDGYEPYTAGTATSVPWSGVTGKPGNATTSTDGFMSAVDKTKLDGISEGATKVEKSDTNGNIKVDGTETVVYTHPTTAGNKHIPAGGAANQVLEYDSAGTAKWGHTVQSDVPENAKFTDTTYGEATEEDPGLMPASAMKKLNALPQIYFSESEPEDAPANSIWFKIVDSIA